MTNPNMHTENVSNDGVITDGGELSVTTYYRPCIGIINADGYLRVVSDDPGHDIETRIDHATLNAAGWTKGVVDAALAKLEEIRTEKLAAKGLHAEASAVSASRVILDKGIADETADEKRDRSALNKEL